MEEEWLKIQNNMKILNDTKIIKLKIQIANETIDLLTHIWKWAATNHSKEYICYNEILSRLTEKNVNRLKEDVCSFFQNDNIEFFNKSSGIQYGIIAKIFDKKYHIKTHQYGATSNSHTSKSPDAKELFIYSFLEKIGYGPKCDFFVSATSRKSLYILTEDLPQFIPYSHIRNITNNIVQEFNRLDFISRILTIKDCTTNSGNFGMNGEKGVIIDFRIDFHHNYIIPSITKEYISGNSKYNYFGLMKECINVSPDEKIDIIKNFNKKELLDALDLSHKKILEFIYRNSDININSETDLGIYVECVKKNICEF